MKVAEVKIEIDQYQEGKLLAISKIDGDLFSIIDGLGSIRAKVDKLEQTSLDLLISDIEDISEHIGALIDEAERINDTLRESDLIPVIEQVVQQSQDQDFALPTQLPLKN
jgi:hypothetical protein